MMASAWSLYVWRKTKKDKTTSSDDGEGGVQPESSLYEEKVRASNKRPNPRRQIVDGGSKEAAH